MGQKSHTWAPLRQDNVLCEIYVLSGRNLAKIHAKKYGKSWPVQKSAKRLLLTFKVRSLQDTKGKLCCIYFILYVNG
jgi:hypothetical protein